MTGAVVGLSFNYMASRWTRCREWYARQPTLLKVGIGAVAVVAAGVGAVGAGVVLAPAVGGVVSAAGFGVAGGTLSGAAASSAGLAAIGGGSIAAGGAGVAGGTAVVAGVFGAGGAAAATVGATLSSREITRQGAHLADLGRKARETEVDNGGIRFD